MMQAKRAELTTYVCGFAFLLGGVSGCLTGFLCSYRAQQDLAAYLFYWLAINASGACFAAELLIAVFALIFSLVSFGFIFIPIISTSIGYCFGVILFIAASSSAFTSGQLCLALTFVPDVFLMLQFNVYCCDISKGITGVWTSLGAKVFDLRYSLRRIWLDLFLIWILFTVRRILI